MKGAQVNIVISFFKINAIFETYVCCVYFKAYFNSGVRVVGDTGKFSAESQSYATAAC